MMSSPCSTRSEAETDRSPHLSPPFSIRFWGVRGSIPTPGAENAYYGGNTPCVEINVAGQRIIFDGGTGLRVLGKNLLQEMPIQAHLFFTHTYWDRIQGFPFFIPAFLEGNQFDVYSSFGLNGASIKQRLSDQMLRPNFPAPLQEMRSQLTFHDICPGSVVTLGDVTIAATILNRASGALGYRVCWRDSSQGEPYERTLVYAIDAEWNNAQICPNLLSLAHQTDVLIYDTAYGDHLYYPMRAAGTGCQPEVWQVGMQVAIASQAKQIIMFHHDPDHGDALLQQVEQDLQNQSPSLKFAREGTTITIP
ncbi:MAG: MBL fold metallo-hydrolase [Oculatellaceae cyanobacterium Prado106]|jgi:phosphoribosyl 1,2-cyclic phosphodiesterase|nr:MBL fold metallo-hydrolase [Oculatellaceae cyanobacterium Prado106]